MKTQSITANEEENGVLVHVCLCICVCVCVCLREGNFSRNSWFPPPSFIKKDRGTNHTLFTILSKFLDFQLERSEDVFASEEKIGTGKATGQKIGNDCTNKLKMS